MIVGRIRLGRLVDHLRVGCRKRTAVHARVRQEVLVEEVHGLNAPVRLQLQDLALKNLHLHAVQHELVGDRVPETSHAAATEEIGPEGVFSDAVAGLRKVARIVGYGRGRGWRWARLWLWLWLWLRCWWRGRRGLRLRILSRGKADCVGNHDTVRFIGEHDGLTLFGLKIEAAQLLPSAAIDLLVDGDVAVTRVRGDLVRRVGGAIGSGAPLRVHGVAAGWASGRERPGDAGRAVARRAEQVIGAVETGGFPGSRPVAFDLNGAVAVVDDGFRGEAGSCQRQQCQEEPDCQYDAPDHCRPCRV